MLSETYILYASDHHQLLNRRRLFSAKICSGICMAERIANYCDAVLIIDTLCKPGYKCCVSRDAFGDFPPPELVVIDRTNSSRYDEKNSDGTFNKISSSSTTVRPDTSLSTNVSTIIATTVTTTTLPTITTTSKLVSLKPCKGQCRSDLFALLCDNVDSDADCPAEGSVLTICCINEPPSPPPPQKTVKRLAIQRVNLNRL